MKIFHNLRNVRPDPTQWYLAHASSAERFIFLDAGSDRQIIRTPADGWTREDANSFHERLMGWDHIDTSRETL